MAVTERDPYSGHMTTGHEWNGIKELNRPVPRMYWWFLSATVLFAVVWWVRSEEHTSELQSLMRSSYAVFCLKKKILLYIRPTHTSAWHSTTRNYLSGIVQIATLSLMPHIHF